MNLFDALPYIEILAKLVAAGLAVLIAISAVQSIHEFDEPADGLETVERCVGFVILLLVLTFIGLIILL